MGNDGFAICSYMCTMFCLCLKGLAVAGQPGTSPIVRYHSYSYSYRTRSTTNATTPR